MIFYDFRFDIDILSGKEQIIDFIFIFFLFGFTIEIMVS